MSQTSDKNVAKVTKSDIDILNALIYVYEARLPNYNELMDSEVKSLKNILAEREQMLKAINTVEKEKGEWIEECVQKDKRIQELEEENTKLKAQHVFTRNEATDEEKAELYDVIDKTLDTFLEKEKTMWQQEMTTNKMSLEEAINIVDTMYQDRYKIIQENDTIYVDRLKDVKFTNLEFASVILLREVQSLQSKLKNSIEQELLEGGKEN